MVGARLCLSGDYAPVALAKDSGALAVTPYSDNSSQTSLVDWPRSPDASFVFLAAGVIGAASFIEGYLITPYIYSESLSLPRVRLLFFLFAFGTLSGVNRDRPRRPGYGRAGRRIRSADGENDLS